MIDTKKEQEREELHRTIWGIANDLRGSVDGWDFKQYVLGMLFYRYISENFRNFFTQFFHFALRYSSPSMFTMTPSSEIALALLR